MKYRKKPVVIEATQWFKMGDHPAVGKFFDHDPEQKQYGWIKTLEGGHIVTPGDWIITGVVGETYPCKPDIFEMTYEAMPTDEDYLAAMGPCGK
jgi:hypothetical protein